MSSKNLIVSGLSLDLEIGLLQPVPFVSEGCESGFLSMDICSLLQLWVCSCQDTTGQDVISHNYATFPEYRLVCLGQGTWLVFAFKRLSDQITTWLTAQHHVVHANYHFAYFSYSISYLSSVLLILLG